ncbi:DUF4097 family beta strand repeat-containing protein [Kibdelosporangium phytohabitans]|uniref:DUF4097 domain-containing protein n=1 Tax=Kibdelosporangium phytohabitans TaxID=860235 RepID=A0A0N7F507_9PSEU|nr:DUF4097 family beta strand repeat-containing protein [Kibdelosporangium phytohabitans]ALG12903.1 hypothetical protein AOZ06_44025 [Kibdelosporangium phytohabitans]MBE1464609.1 hypothetical protein [Kibdelosporangium phytohabitans]
MTEDRVREQNFEADGPQDIEVTITSGAVDLLLTDEPGVSVRVRHRPDAAAPWAEGLSQLMNLFSSGGISSDNAIEQTHVEQSDNRLVVRTPDWLRNVPLGVTVRAPSGSNIDVRSGSGDVLVTGSAGRLSVRTGSGEVKVDRADGAATVVTGTGAVRLGPMLGGLQARTGSGDVEVSSVGGVSAALITGSGDVWLGAVSTDVNARTGTGDLTVADAAKGKIELNTGSGEIRVGVRQGTRAEVDLVSDTGQARSELDLRNSPPSEGDVPLRVRGRTRSGTAVVGAALDG